MVKFDVKPADNPYNIQVFVNPQNLCITIISPGSEDVIFESVKSKQTRGFNYRICFQLLSISKQQFVRRNQAISWWTREKLIWLIRKVNRTLLAMRTILNQLILKCHHVYAEITTGLTSVITLVDIFVILTLDSYSTFYISIQKFFAVRRVLLRKIWPPKYSESTL